MPNYCEIGDTARVTFPNGSIQDFTDTPISIECKDNVPNCTLLFIDYSFRQSNGSIFFGQTTVRAPMYSFVLTSNQNNLGLWNYNLIITGATLNPANSLCNLTPTDKLVASGGNGAQQSRDLKIIKIFNASGVVPGKRLRIFGNSGVELFNNIFDNCNYSVECIKGCPPNTLDCGDCCLPCDEVFNKISDIRRLLSRIK